MLPTKTPIWTRACEGETEELAVPSAPLAVVDVEAGRIEREEAVDTGALDTEIGSAPTI